MDNGPAERAHGRRQGFWRTALRRGLMGSALWVGCIALLASLSWLLSPSVREADGNNFLTTLVSGSALAVYTLPWVFLVAVASSGISSLRRVRETRTDPGTDADRPRHIGAVTCWSS